MSSFSLVLVKLGKATRWRQQTRVLGKRCTRGIPQVSLTQPCSESCWEWPHSSCFYLDKNMTLDKWDPDRLQQVPYTSSIFSFGSAGRQGVLRHILGIAVGRQACKWLVGNKYKLHGLTQSTWRDLFLNLLESQVWDPWQQREQQARHGKLRVCVNGFICTTSLLVRLVYYSVKKLCPLKRKFLHLSHLNFYNITDNCEELSKVHAEPLGPTQSQSFSFEIARELITLTHCNSSMEMTS